MLTDMGTGKNLIISCSCCVNIVGVQRLLGTFYLIERMLKILICFREFNCQ